MEPLSDSFALPDGITSSFVPDVNNLTVHTLQAGIGNARTLLLLHGFPEIAYSWRKVMGPLADAGFHAVAPDSRGYGRTTSAATVSYDDDLQPFSALNLCRDVIHLVHALKWASVDLVIGHDMGSPVAAWLSLIRPDIFKSVIMMSAPFPGPPPARPMMRVDGVPTTPLRQVHKELASLGRKHYQMYYTTREANHDMHYAPEGIKAFLRAYFHHKSADWAENKPHPLTGWTADQLATLPTYYIMHIDKNMAQTVTAHMPTSEQIASNTWLTDAEMEVYAHEYKRTGFQGGLQVYRTMTSPEFQGDMSLFSGQAISVPSMYISGSADWGVYQSPGVLELMQSPQVCRNFMGVVLLDGAGHWAQQEASDAVVRTILEFYSQAF